MYKGHITLDQIESMRTRVMILANEKGFTDEETVTASQSLDVMLNQYREGSREWEG